MTETGDQPARRPLLVGGERLAERVNRAQRASSPKFHPQTVEQARDLLLPQARDLASAAARIPAERRGRRVVFQADLLPNYLANSYFPLPLLSYLGLVALGSRRTLGVLETNQVRKENVPTKSLVLAGSDVALDRLGDLLERGASTTSGRTAEEAEEAVRRLSAVRLPDVDEIVRAAPSAASPEPGETEPSSTPGYIRADGVLRPALGEDGLVVHEAVLHPSPDEVGPLDERLYAKWRTYVNTLGGRVPEDAERVVGKLKFVPVLLPPGAAADAAAFNPLRAIRPMPRLRPLPSLAPSPLRSATPIVAPPPPPPPGTQPAGSARIAVFDGGVDTAAVHFASGVAEADLTPEPCTQTYLDHGSAVTAALLYGDLGAAPSATATALAAPPAAISHYRCVPPPDTADADLNWVLDQIIKVVDATEPDVVNLSLGPDFAVEDDEPHRWTVELDRLAYEKGVLFVVAAGNNGKRPPTGGVNRVQVPADMANGLSVGACDVRAPHAPWARAPYSAVGPGRPAARVQPAGICFGGIEDRTPFLALRSDGTLAHTQGTSFAAPLATHSLAVLAARLGPGRTTANNLRAFAVHFAEPPARGTVAEEVGHGRFCTDYDVALDCAEHEVHLLYEGRIGRDEILAHRLPLPRAITAGMIELRWTLVITSPTDPAEALEYTQAGLDVTFRPHARKHSYTGPQGKSEKLDKLERADRVAELLSSDHTQSREPVTRPVRGKALAEHDRREDGKWQTVRHARDRMRARTLFDPRLDISYLHRKGGMLARDVSAIDYSLLVTVSAGPGVNLYDEVRTAFALTALTETRPRMQPQIRPRLET